jgi:SsrA-binding protein
MASKRIAENKKGRFDSAIELTYEAGLVLTGDEIKSIRADRAQLTGAYVKMLQNRPVLINMHLGLAKQPTRTRHLLLSARQLSEIERQLQVGRHMVPLEVRLVGRWAKLVLGVGRGRKQHDKRSLLKERAIARDAARSLSS